MTVQFRCPQCGMVAAVAEEFTGQVVTCTRCGRFAAISLAPFDCASGPQNDAEGLFVGHRDNLTGDAADRCSETINGDRTATKSDPNDSIIQISDDDILTESAEPGVFFVGLQRDIVFIDDIDPLVKDNQDRYGGATEPHFLPERRAVASECDDPGIQFIARDANDCWQRIGSRRCP